MARHRHIDASFDAELRQLKERVLAMGRVVEKQVNTALSAFVRRDLERARTLAKGDREVNALERALDERCVSLLALRQPAASDLRLLASILKMVTDLERIGDLAVDVAGRAQALASKPPPHAAELLALSAAAVATLRDSLEAFVQSDTERARSVLAKEQEMDVAVGHLLGWLRDEMIRDASLVPNGTATLMATLHVQRMAAHARNIAEMVIYSESGEDVRHLAG